jgi:hypothetical protein
MELFIMQFSPSVISFLLCPKILTYALFSNSPNVNKLQSIPRI